MSAHTLITASTHVRGAITGDDNLIVDGQIEGNIRLEGDLSLHADGRIIGNVEADNILINGTVKGNINARTHLKLSKTARVQGDLTAPAILIEDGALIRGDVDVGSLSAAAPKKAKPTKKKTAPKDGDDVVLPEGTVGRKVKVKTP